MLDKLDVFDARVRERAFSLWEQAGCPENRADEYWHRAREIEMREYDLSEDDLRKAATATTPADFA